MDLKSENILTVDLTVDIDPTILLGLEFEKMNFVSELDVESVLSEGDNKIIETNNTLKDLENQDSKTPDTKSECDTEESIPSSELERNKDINGNEETLSDYNLNWLFNELELSDSDNEEKDEETPFPRLRERGGPIRRSTKKQNRQSYLNSNKYDSSDKYDTSDKYDKSQINPRDLQFLSRSFFVESNNTSNYSSLENNHPSTFNSNEVFYNVTSNKPVSTSYPQFYEDSRVNSIGSPESGYESSLTGSPPSIVSSTFINQKLESISQLDDDQFIFINQKSESISQLDDDQFINYILEDPAVCALTDHAIPKQHIDNKEYKEKKINELVEFFKNTSNELVLSNTVVSCNRNSDILPRAESFEDINNFSIILPPVLKNTKMPKLKYKLKEEAKLELRRLLQKDKFWATEKKIFRRLMEDKRNNKPTKVIHITNEMDKTSEIRTNLHHAVLNENLEEIYCLVEIQKQYDLDLSDLNIRDKYEKTALDYAIGQHMDRAVIDYLIENTACQNVKI